MAYMVAYNSNPDTVANPIIKAEIAARNPNEPLGMPVYVTNAGGISRRRWRITPEHNELLNRGDGVVIPPYLFQTQMYRLKEIQDALLHVVGGNNHTTRQRR